MKHFILSNVKRQASADEAIKKQKKPEFFKKTDDDEKFEEQINEDAFSSLEHAKTDSPYVPPTVQDVLTIEKEIKRKPMIL